MRVKRYVVNALPEALPMIRTELGKDAVILNTKEIRVGGFLGMFRKKKMEVIAAIESGTQMPAAQAPVAATARPIPKLAAQPSDLTGYAAVAKAVQAPLPSTGAAVAEMDKEVPNSAVTAPAAAVKVQENKFLQDNMIMEELRQMKDMVVQLSKQRSTSPHSPALAALQQRMWEQEVDSQWIDKLLLAVPEDELFHPEASRQEVWEIAGKHLLDWLHPLQDEGVRSEVRIVHFVGPTGVGKTTTIAKLAAEQTLKHKRKVGFITSDTYRIAAVDQLRTYANILNVPLEVVFSPNELTKAFKQLEDRDLIFMDTAGRNFRNELYVSEVNSLIQAKDDTETYLVLSLTGKSKDMYVVAEHFAKYGVNKVLFTKMDETETCGAILNLMLEHQFKPAYIAFGQNVPDDIERFNINNYVGQLLGAAIDE